MRAGTFICILFFETCFLKKYCIKIKTKTVSFFKTL